MTGKLYRIHLMLFLILSFFYGTLVSQTPEKPLPDKPDKDAVVAVPSNAEAVVAVPGNAVQAREIFSKAWSLEKESQYQQALAHYDAVLVFYRNNKQNDQVIIVLNNIGTIMKQIGKYEKTLEVWREGLQLAMAGNDLRKAAEFHHKLGIMLEHLAKLQEYNEHNPALTDKRAVAETSGTYTSLVQLGQQVIANCIYLKGNENPFDRQQKPYRRLVNLKLKGDFETDDLLRPDSVELLIQLRKNGYFPIGKNTTLLPQVEYCQFDEMMVAIPRTVKPQISEDFYKTGIITPDEITLLTIGDDKAKPVLISDREVFKPAVYQLSVKKAGYTPILKQITIEPGEGPYSLPIELISKMRSVSYILKHDFTPMEQKKIIPDEISLNGQPVREETTVKPGGDYKLVIKKDGYEAINKTIAIIPAEDTHVINEYMRVLPREVIFQIAGDYQDEILSPDEVALNGRPIKSGDPIRPDSYQAVIRKRGYDIVSDKILIEPRSEPYILKKGLVSTPRRIDLFITGDVPKGVRIAPEIATLNNKPITPDETFKPGEYILALQHNGYHARSKKVNISPDNVPYRIEELLLAKPREIKIEIDRDVLPEDPKIPTKVVLVNERTSEIIAVKSGDKIAPESYLLKIEQAGYEPDISKHFINPNEDIYSVNRILISSMREVVGKIIAEYPPKMVISPDTFTLANKIVGKDFKIKPGTHDLVITAEGYLPVREAIKILASPKEYKLSKILETRTRPVNFVFLDSYNGSVLKPDEVMMKDQKITLGKPQEFKPGKYDFGVRMSGYISVNEEIEIPVGMTPHKVERALVASKRLILPNIVSDYTKTSLKLEEIDVFTLNDIQIEGMKDKNTGKIEVKPGNYTMVLYKKGYDKITKPLNIVPAPTPYDIQETLISKPRALEITLKSSFPFAGKAPLVADTLNLNERKVKHGDTIKPGEYALTIGKTGYKNITEPLVIEPAETPYLIDRILEPKQRAFKYKVLNDVDNQEMPPDLITVNEKSVETDATFIPGKYPVKVEKLGYYPKKQEILIEPSNDPYMFTCVMVTMNREIDLQIFSDFPKGEVIDPLVASLSGKDGTKDAREGGFKPGKYTLELQQPGFQPIKEEVTILPEEERFRIERTMISLPRVIDEKITYDVQPPDGLGAYKITIALKETSTQESVIKKGDKLKPAEYVLRITKEAYDPLEKPLFIWPSPESLVIKEELVSKQILLLIDISHDVNAPEKYTEYSVSLIDKTNIPRYVKHGHRTKPGSYKLKVERPGYTFGAPKEIYIAPSEKPYQIKERLIADKRQLSFEMVDTSVPGREVMVPAKQIINKKTGEEVTFKHFFQPGEQIDLIAKFDNYKTVSKAFIVEPGEGPFKASVPMTKLKFYEFFVRHADKKIPPFANIDGIEYPYTFYVDFKPVEEHHVKASVAPGGKWAYMIAGETNAQNLQAFSGYMYVQYPITRGGTLPRPDSISVPRLIEHLEQIIKTPEKGHRGALDILETGLRSASWKKMLDPKEADALINYIDALQVDEGLRQRVKLIIDAIKRLQVS